MGYASAEDLEIVEGEVRVKGVPTSGVPLQRIAALYARVCGPVQLAGGDDDGVGLPYPVIRAHHVPPACVLVPPA